MKRETGILMTAPNVLAIEANRKLETRRLQGLKALNECPDDWEILNVYRNDLEVTYHMRNLKDGGRRLFKSPYGIPGDLLWVRETWDAPGPFGVNGRKIYRADIPGGKHPYGYKWKPSLFMPKEACRYWLEVTEIHLERLHDITEQGAIDEGILFYEDGIMAGVRYKDYLADASGYGDPEHDYPSTDSAIESYRTLFIAVYSLDAWEQNPWVWVVKFKRIER